MSLALVCPVHVFLREQHHVGPTQCLLAWVWEGGRKRGGRERSRLTEQHPSLTGQTRQLTEVRGLAGARGGGAGQHRFLAQVSSGEEPPWKAGIQPWVVKTEVGDGSCWRFWI